VKTVDDLAAEDIILAEWAAFVGALEVLAARRTLVGLEVAACDRNAALSDPKRLDDIERIRTSHIQQAAKRWETLAGARGAELASSITSQISAAYEAEAKSFYDAAMEKFDDRDSGKDYPDLPVQIQSSPLDQRTKDFYQNEMSFLRYEEAGRLSDAFKGLDKDKRLNYA
jgi:hypothetical protein